MMNSIQHLRVCEGMIEPAVR